MEQYNWKDHYDVDLREIETTGSFTHYKIDEPGDGDVISCTVFPGIQALYNDLNLYHCGKIVPRTEDVLEINYCIGGRYECEVSSQYCFYAISGDLSIGNAGRREAAGSFPTGHFTGLTLFIEPKMVSGRNASILQDLKIDLELIKRMAFQDPRRFYIRGKSDIDVVCRQMISAITDHDLPLLKLKTLELLMKISDPDLIQRNNIPVYLSQKNVQLAKNIREKISKDLSCHLTLQQLSSEFHVSPTAIKTAFKTVYGETIREYLKTIRLQEAQRLLRDTDWHILEIAEMVGYSNPGHFAVAFRERYTMTPSEFRNSIRSKWE